MSAYLYDKAITDKISSWVRDTNLHIYSPSDTARLFEVISDEGNDSPIKLPILAIRRNGGYTISNFNKQPLTYSGVTLAKSEQKAVQLNAVPINLTYQLDIYTRYLQEADEYARNLVFNLINFPIVTVHLPYQDMDIAHNSSILLQSTVEDNSSIPERIITGQFTRLTLQFVIPDAYLWDVRIRDNVRLYLGDVLVEE